MESTELTLYGKYGKGKVALVDGDYDGEYFKQYRWYLSKNGYVIRVMIELPSSERKGYIYLHHEVCRAPAGMVRDHINRDKLDNRSCNLRHTDKKGNAWNRTFNKNKIGSKKYKGVDFVYWSKTPKWRARIAGKTIGFFETELGAAKAYNTAGRIIYGKMGVYNSIK